MEMAAPAAKDDDSFPFCPSNVKLVDRYLRAKLDGVIGDVANAAFFLDADVCSARPQDLVRAHRKPARVSTRDASDGQQFYFFSPVRFLGSSQKKKTRTIAGTNGKESWHAEGCTKPVEGSVAGGFVQRLSYHVRVGPKSKNVEKPGWIMLEYSFEGGKTVLCKIYKSPRGPGVSMMRSGCKRKAADDLEAATPVTRPRQTQTDDVVLFAGDEHKVMSAEYQAAAPEFTEMQNVQESQPELPLIVPASFDGNMVLDDDPRPRQTYYQEEVDDIPFTGYGEYHYHAEMAEFIETQNVDEVQPEPQIAPASSDSGMTLGDLHKMMMADEDDNGTMLQVPDGVDPVQHYMGYLLGNGKQHGAAVQTQHAPPLTDYDVMAALAAGFTLDDLLSPSCPHLGGGASNTSCS